MLCALYLATFFCLGTLAAAAGWPFFKWVDLAAIVAATGVTILIAERGRWAIGLAAPPRVALAEAGKGIAFAAVLIVAADVLIVVSSPLRHGGGGGFPWLEIVIVFLPAAFHEELTFRGYVYQKLRTWNRGGAVAVTAIVFAAMHGDNAGVTPIALANLLLAGVLLALAYERHQRLWLPIGIHFGWNVVSGPILGYGVSGYVAGATVLTARPAGPGWISGGSFGIEGSVWMLAVESLGIIAMARKGIVRSV